MLVVMKCENSFFLQNSTMKKENKKQYNIFGIIKLNCIWQLKRAIATAVSWWRNQYYSNKSQLKWCLLLILQPKLVKIAFPEWNVYNILPCFFFKNKLATATFCKPLKRPLIFGHSCKNNIKQTKKKRSTQS